MKKVYLHLLLWLVVATAFFFACQRQEPAPLQPENASGTKASARTTDGAAEATTIGTYEAEKAVLSGAKVATNQTGYTGTGFVDYINATGDYIEWTVYAEAAGSFLLKFRYANGGTANRPLQLKVNGTTVAASLTFSPTGSFGTWSVAS